MAVLPYLLTLGVFALLGIFKLLSYSYGWSRECVCIGLIVELYPSIRMDLLSVRTKCMHACVYSNMYVYMYICMERYSRGSFRDSSGSNCTRQLFVRVVCLFVFYADQYLPGPEKKKLIAKKKNVVEKEIFYREILNLIYGRF